MRLLLFVAINNHRSILKHLSPPTSNPYILNPLIRMYICIYISLYVIFVFLFSTRVMINIVQYIIYNIWDIEKLVPLTKTSSTFCYREGVAKNIIFFGMYYIERSLIKWYFVYFNFIYHPSILFDFYHPPVVCIHSVWLFFIFLQFIPSSNDHRGYFSLKFDYV